MSFSTFLKGVMILILSCFLAWVTFRRYDEEIGTETAPTGKRRYLPYLNGFILPSLPFMLFSVYAIFYGSKEAFQTVIPICFGLFLNVSIYYALLLPFLPLLRKRISARVCALLWLLPNYTYLAYFNSLLGTNKPLLILHIPKKLMSILLWVWLTGFIAVFVYSIVQHLVFRRTILKDSVTIGDPKVLDIWENELSNAGLKKVKYALVRSGNVATPLSIGFFVRTIRIVLPQKEYTNEELALILRHELIHICRGDSSSKFSIMFCCAMCWFNPLMWIAMRKSAEDMELSCDETVLLSADSAQRKQYVDLILDTAADDRGFTTCLSASASALRYRLQRILKQAQRSAGSLIAAILCFVLFICSGMIGISYGSFTVRDLMFKHIGIEQTSDWEITGMNTTLLEHSGFLECTDPDALLTYLTQLEVSRLSGNYTLERYDKQVLILLDSPSGGFYLELKDKLLEFGPLGELSSPFDYYQVLTPIDWDYLTGLFQNSYVQDPALSFPPHMTVVPDDSSTYYLNGKLDKMYTREKLIHENASLDYAPVIEYTDPATENIAFTFSHTPSIPFKIEVTNEQIGTVQTITYHQLAPSYTLPIIGSDSHYRCIVTFRDSVTTVEMEYPFDLCRTNE